jgi:hypothetical protein
MYTTADTDHQHGSLFLRTGTTIYNETATRLHSTQPSSAAAARYKSGTNQHTHARINSLQPLFTHLYSLFLLVASQPSIIMHGQTTIVHPDLFSPLAVSLHGHPMAAPKVSQGYKFSFTSDIFP